MENMAIVINFAIIVKSLNKIKVRCYVIMIAKTTPKICKYVIQATLTTSRNAIDEIIADENNN